MQRFGFAYDSYYEVKDDDIPCRKNRVVPYDELYALKRVPLHLPEAVKHYVDRKRRRKREIRSIGYVTRDLIIRLVVAKKECGYCGSDKERKKMKFIMLENRNKFKNCLNE